MSQSTIDLILRVGGQDALDHLAKSTANYRGLIEELAAKFARGDINADEYQRRLAKLSGELEKQDRLFRQLTQSQDHVATGTARVKEAHQDAGKAAGSHAENIRGLSNTFNDFFGVTGSMGQRINAIANNMPQLFAGFGTIGLALAGIMPIIAMVIQNWDTMTAFLGTASDFVKSRVEALQKTIADLEAKPVKFAIDLTNLREAKKELADLEAGQQAFEAWAKSRVKPQEESGAKFKEILGGEPGGAKISAALEKRMAESAVAFDPEIKKSKREANDARLAYERAEKDAAKEEGLLGKLPYLAEASSGRAAEKAAIARANTREQLVRDQATKEAGGVYKSATEGDPAAQARMIGELKQSGMDAVAGRLEAATPAALKAQEKVRNEITQKVILPLVADVTKHFRDLKTLRTAMAESAAEQEPFYAHAVEPWKHESPAEAGAARSQAEARARFKTQRDVEQASLAGSSIDERATAEAAQMAAAGGAVNPATGGVHKLDDTGQFIRLAGLISQEIARAKPELGETMNAELATRMAMKATDAAQATFQAKRAEVADAVGTQAAQTGQTVPQLLGVTSQQQANQAITNEAIRQTLVAVNNLQQQALQNGAQIQALGRVAGATAAETTARTRSPQRVGQP